jgi:formylglycine-generating enzyme required for sulfatase activity
MGRKLMNLNSPSSPPTSKCFIIGLEVGSSDEKSLHEVIINYDFEIAQTPVTVEEYLHFVKATKKEKREEWTKERENHPVTYVSWNDAVEFCKWLNEQQKKYVYRLPSEAEWEYACRAGTTTTWSFGDDEKELDKYAWYRNNSDGSTHEVGKKKENPWGLKDMYGNVWEWCLDDYEDNYNNTPRDGSEHTIDKKKYKSLRGGSWVSDASYARSASRIGDDPADRYSNMGFRLLRTLP